MKINRIYIYIIIVICPFLLITTAFAFSLENNESGTDLLSYFSKVHLKKGLDFTGYLGQTASWGDFNNDGCLDLFISNTDINDHPATYLFKNLCNGKFVELNSSIGISDKWPIRSSAWADYDNDGYIDLVLGGIDVYMKPFLYNNQDGIIFDERSTFAGLSEEGVGKSFIWIDYNLDGLVDLFETSYGLRLYKNLGKDGFKEVSFDSGIAGFGKGANSSIWLDYNNDSYPDLLILRRGTNVLLKNNGDETFSDVTEQAKVKGNKRWRSVASCTGDFNNDGFFDIYVVNIGSSRNSLYRNNGDGTFTDITYDSATADVGDGRTCSFVDFDSDGLVDIFTTNHVNPSKMFRNLGNEMFKDVAKSLGIHVPIDVFSAAWGDFNGDAVLDVFLNGHIGQALYRGFNINNSFTVELIGDGINTNTSAIGSRVIVKSGSTDQVKEVSGGKGCCEQDMLPLHFGLGKESAFEMAVKWTSGKTCTYNNLNVEDARIYKIWEKDCVVFSR